MIEDLDFFQGFLFVIVVCFPKVCGRKDEFTLLLELGDDIQVSLSQRLLLKWQKITKEKIFYFHSGISTWLFGFSYVVGIHSLWYLLFVQVGMIFKKK